MPRHKLTKDDSIKGGKNSVRTVSLKTAITDAFLKAIKKKGVRTPENFVNACIDAGMDGNSGMAKLIFEYNDGKVKEEIDINQKTVIIRSEKESKYMLGED